MGWGILSRTHFTENCLFFQSPEIVFPVKKFSLFMVLNEKAWSILHDRGFFLFKKVANCCFGCFWKLLSFLLHLLLFLLLFVEKSTSFAKITLGTLKMIFFLVDTSHATKFPFFLPEIVDFGRTSGDCLDKIT